VFTFAHHFDLVNTTMGKKAQHTSQKQRSTRSNNRTGRVCPNPACKNKQFLTYAGFHRHIIQRQECKEFMENEDVETPPTPISQFSEFCLPISSILTSELEPATDEEIENFNHISNVEDYEDSACLYDDLSTFHSTKDYLIIPDNEIIFTDDQRIEVSLLRLCTDMDAPLWAFEHIMDWAHDAFVRDYKFIPKQGEYKSQIPHLQKWLNMKNLRPIEKEVDLPGAVSGTTHRIKVTTFDFKSQVHSLLSDPVLNKAENLVFNADNPFGKYVPPDGKLGECISGSWYNAAWEHMVNNQLGDYMCPVILYIDKTALSINGKLTLHPVMMSLSIFTSKIRRQSYAWRPLGYIANEAVHFSKDQRKEAKADIKSIRLHTILEAILSTFKAAQLPGALHQIKMQLGPHNIARCNLYMPLQFIIGDVEGGDILCSRWKYYGKCERLCRTCDVSTDGAADTTQECTRIRLDDIKHLLATNDTKQLKYMAQRPGLNSFYDIDCGNDPYGVFSMIHSEGLHAIEIGLIPYMLEILMKDLKPKRCGDLDRLVQRFYDEPRQHAQENFPRYIWKDGVTNLSQLTGQEKVGKMYAITLVALTLEGQEFFCKYLPGGRITWERMLYVFQQILCYWSWLKEETFWATNDLESMENATAAIKVMMRQIQVLWPRQWGLEWNLTKLHEQFHIPFDIFRHGAHHNVHSGPQEHNHLAQKRAALNTQRRKILLDLQTGERVIDRLIISYAYDMIINHTNPSTEPINNSLNGISSVSTKGHIQFFQNSTGPRNEMDGGVFWNNTNYNPYSIPLINHIFSLLAKSYFANYSQDHINTRGHSGRQLQIPIFSEYKRDGVSYRCHPYYRSFKPHYDWSYIRWEDPNNEGSFKDNIAQILLFYESPIDSLIYAIIHSVKERSEKQHSVFGTKYEMERNGRGQDSPPQLWSVSVDCLEHHAFMVRYQEKNDFVWFHVWDQSTWADCFQKIEDG
jgi:hypothetical protein